MRKVLLAVSLVLLFSCTNKPTTKPKVADQNRTEEILRYVRQPKIIEIDSCEYVIGRYRMAHKGNCKFCKERRDKERKQLIVELKNLMCELRESDLLFMEE